MSTYYCESCGSGQNEYINSGSLPVALPGQPNVGFNIGGGFIGGDLTIPRSASISSIQSQTDGKILVGGDFYAYSGSSVGYSLIRLESDGTIDTTFDIGSGFYDNTIGSYGYVLSMQIQSDGKILVGGVFNEYNGTSVGYGLIRLESDGTIDATFDVGSGFDDNNVGTANILSIQIQSDGKILVGGYFDEYSGTSVGYGLIRLESDGTIDTTFDIGSGFGGYIDEITLQPDGKILVGGSFGSSLIRLNTDGSVDESFVVGTGFDIGSVYTIGLQPDGKILVGGNFTSYSGVSSNYIIRLNTDGSIDSSFNIGTGFDNPVNAVTLQSDGKILVGGYFTSYSGVSYNEIIRLNTDGSIDTSFVIGTGFDTSNTQVSTISLRSDGKIFVGGSFTLFNDYNSRAICLIDSEPITTIINTTDLRCYTPILNINNNIDPTFNIGTGFNNYVSDIGVQSDGKILVGGVFTTYSGVSKNRIIRLNTDYTIDTSFVIGTGFNNTVTVTTLQSDGKILVGGTFSTYSGVSRNRIVRLNTDGSVDTSFVVGTGFNSGVESIVLQSDGKILVGGDFTSYSGVSRNRIIRLNTNGSVDASFVIGTGFNSGVNDITLQSDGKILVGGDFSTYSGATRSRIIRLNTNGSIDNSFVIGTGFDFLNSYVSSIELQPDGKVLVGGNFGQYSGSSVGNNLIRLNTDGSVDTSFVVGTGFDNVVYDISLQSNGMILVGGDFTSYYGNQSNLKSNRIIRLNTEGLFDTNFFVGTGFNSIVRVINTQSNGEIFVGGSFTTLNSESYPRFALLLEEPFQGDLTALELFTNCETCYGTVIPSIPRSANTEYIDCLICNGDALLVDAPHPVWTGLNGGAVTQMDAVTIGGNGWNS